MNTYTIEEIYRWINDTPRATPYCPKFGIAAWKERQERRDADVRWLRWLSRANAGDMFCGEPMDDKLKAIADRLESLQKERDELASRLANAMRDCETANLEAARFKAACDKYSEVETLGNLLPQPDADGWIPHTPGEMPCDPDILVDFIMRYETPETAECDTKLKAGELTWTECGQSTITHWRPAK